MSELGPIVVAAMRDKVVADLLEENRILTEEKSNLLGKLDITVQSSDPGGPHSVVYARISPSGDVEHLIPLTSVEEILKAEIWLGPRWLFLDTVGHLSVDSILYERVVFEGTRGGGDEEDNNSLQEIREGPLSQQQPKTNVRIDTKWLCFQVVIPRQLLDHETHASFDLGIGHETVQDVLLRHTAAGTLGGQQAHGAVIKKWHPSVAKLRSEI